MDPIIVENHHEVLPHWVKLSNELARPLPLITIDNHTDLHKAFLRYGFSSTPDSWECDRKLAAASARMRQVDKRSEESLRRAVANLYHDEHIDCAMRLGAVKPVYVFLGHEGMGKTLPGVKLFEFDPCVPGCSKAPHDDDCNILQADAVIEAEILRPRLAKIKAKIGPLDTLPYILDIDIDAFSTRKALSPTDPSEFKRLARHASIITVARERDCFADCRLEDDFSFEEAESALLTLLEQH